VAFSPDGRYLAAGNNGNVVGVWEVATGKPLFDTDRWWVVTHHLVLSPDGRRVATEAWEGLARMWDVATGKEILRIPNARGGHPVASPADGAGLLTFGYDQTIRWWDVASGKELRKSPGNYYSVTDVALTPDRRTLVLYSQGWRLLDIDTGKELRRLDLDNSGP